MEKLMNKSDLFNLNERLRLEAVETECLEFKVNNEEPQAIGE